MMKYGTPTWKNDYIFFSIKNVLLHRLETFDLINFQGRRNDYYQ